MKREIKFLLLMLAVFFMLLATSCKKKNITPEPEPEPVPTCQTGLTLFTGTYIDENGSKIFIMHVKNNCPKENSNTYKVDSLDKAINKDRQAQVISPNVKIEGNSDEYSNGNGYMTTGVGKFTRIKETGDIAFVGGTGSPAGGVSLRFKKEK